MSLSRHPRCAGCRAGHLPAGYILRGIPFPQPGSLHINYRGYVDRCGDYDRKVRESSKAGQGK